MSFSPAELSKWCHGEIKLIISDRIHRIRDIACYGGMNLYLMLEQTHVIMIEQTEIKATGGVKQIQEKRSKPTEMSRIVATEATLCRHKRTGQKRFPPAKQKGKRKQEKHTNKKLSTLFDIAVANCAYQKRHKKNAQKISKARNTYEGF